MQSINYLFTNLFIKLIKSINELIKFMKFIYSFIFVFI